MKNEEFSSETTPSAPEQRGLERSGFRRSLAILALQMAAATTLGATRCFMREDTAGTQGIELVFESSTEMRKTTPELMAKLTSILDTARSQIIEDGGNNAITDRFAELFTRDYSALIPVLTAIIDNQRTPPIIAAELLKELGRMRHSASHESRLWLLEHALGMSSPFIRDGAGLGLARLADPAAIKYIQKAIEAEPNPDARADLKLVLDELADTVR